MAISLIGYFAIAPAVTAQSASTTTTTNSSPTWMQQGDWQGAPQVNPGGQFGFANQFGRGGPSASSADVEVGQTFTVTSTSGRYSAVGSQESNGTASGTLTFTVTGKLAEGYTLSISGSITVAGTTYTIASGTAQMNDGASGITGQGSTTPSGEFLLRASAQGSFVGSVGTVSLDLQSGSSEYLVFLTGSIA